MRVSIEPKFEIVAAATTRATSRPPALSGTRADLVGEAADVLFHLVVLLDAAAIPVAEVAAELARREGTSGIAEKAAR